MPEPFQIRHLRPFFQSFALFTHKKPGESNHEAREEHQEFVACRWLGLRFRVRRISQLLIAAALMGSGCGQKTVSPSDFAAQRQRMGADATGQARGYTRFR
jgi:hypothetical protein